MFKQFDGIEHIVGREGVLLSPMVFMLRRKVPACRGIIHQRTEVSGWAHSTGRVMVKAVPFPTCFPH